MTTAKRTGEAPPWRALGVGACLWLVFYGLSHLLAGGDVIAGITRGSLLWGGGLVLLLSLRVFLILVWPTWVLYRASCFLAWRLHGTRTSKQR
ncbi:MAG: hypothetical protein H6718_24710 [Polyangiaceae bacterium]|nr:hypothetical protein [Myxococcales bacterium]MCB9588635.1 hypothetical protein [Polyangiaceae bacterium]